MPGRGSIASIVLAGAPTTVTSRAQARDDAKRQSDAHPQGPAGSGFEVL